MEAIKSISLMILVLCCLAAGGMFAFEGLETMGQSVRAVPFSLISFALAFMFMRAID